jgi:hypothetical protein
MSPEEIKKRGQWVVDRMGEMFPDAYFCVTIVCQPDNEGKSDVFVMSNPKTEREAQHTFVCDRLVRML